MIGMLLGKFYELVDTRRTAERVPLAADDPSTVWIGFGLSDWTEQVAGLGIEIVLGFKTDELLRRGQIAVGSDVGGTVPPRGLEIEWPRGIVLNFLRHVRHIRQRLMTMRELGRPSKADSVTLLVDLQCGDSDLDWLAGESPRQLGEEL